MLWLILGFSWLASVVLILSVLGAVRETENESLAAVSLQSRLPSPLHISNGRMSVRPPAKPTRRVA